MWRTLTYFDWLAILVALAVWLADWGGQVALELPPYRLDLYFVSLAWPGTNRRKYRQVRLFDTIRECEWARSLEKRERLNRQDAKNAKMAGE